jgi:hypothetical protein
MNNRKRKTKMANLSFTRRDVLNRAASAASNAEQARDDDRRVAWAQTARAWVDIANAMPNVAETVTTTF